MRPSRTRRWTARTLALAITGSCFSVGAQPTAPEPPPPVEPWYDALDFSAFVDSYASFNHNLPASAAGANWLRVNDANNGLALSWAGAGVGAEPEPVGGRMSVRFGPLTQSLCGPGLREDCAYRGLETLTQAFASWRPGGGGGPMRLDFGKFETPYGLERAESHRNFSYSRGLVFATLAPRFHTGLRGTYWPVDGLALRGLVVNGWNNTLDDNSEKTFGVQVQYQAGPALSFGLGWLGGAEGSSRSRGWRQPSTWRHLADFVIRYQPLETLSLALNAAAVRDEIESRTELGDVRWQVRRYGAALAAQQEITSVWTIAARVEALSDPQGTTTEAPGAVLGSATLTLQAMPTDNLVVRLEQRDDALLDADGSRRVFPGEGARHSHQLTSTLGVVVMTE